MTHPVPALGAALLTASGCVWWLPALATLRAGADRPDSARGTATACLSGWTTVAGVAVLLLVADPWWAPGALAAVGAATTAGLLIRAAGRRRSESREALATRLAHLHDIDRADPCPWLPPRARMYRARNRFVTVLGVGLGVAVASALLPAAVGPGHGGAGAVVAVPVLLTALFLAVAVGRARVARRFPGSRPGR
ncbi:hypothetical protein [Streptomyces neyagawaensis]|uniref:hypothetical protein n=1 Tax=Streptomyces neyagawaensis TaxID=42238 RepID=UPI0006E2F643|nr:hypothetical protein [Streptomyces neyagawaensis]MCL6735993.1 hypothetical protein [Streptomyces neyagawaensis]MDE1686911.1 hypothetical protein [Streptomyces neyagawaensis]